MSRRPFLYASAVLLLLTLFLTWPQAVNLRTKLANHDDSYFSAWRLAWIAHALRTDPRHLFDANVFYPETRTLAYSDATLLEGVVAAPLLWMGLSPVLLYNVLLLLGIAASGLGMFVLVGYLTGNDNAALVAGAIFVLLPYRVAHYPHLELQWTVWMPLAFWAVHRAVAEQSWRFGVLTGVFVWLQVLSSVYYGIFLAPMVLLLALLLMAERRRGVAVPLAALALGAIVAAALTYPYARPVHRERADARAQCGRCPALQRDPAHLPDRSREELVVGVDRTQAIGRRAVAVSRPGRGRARRDRIDATAAPDDRHLRRPRPGRVRAVAWLQ